LKNFISTVVNAWKCRKGIACALTRYCLGKSPLWAFSVDLWVPRKSVGYYGNHVNLQEFSLKGESKRGCSTRNKVFNNITPIYPANY
jgi:hypothetical protein